MSSARRFSPAILIACVLAVSGCGSEPAPAPSPSASGFSSEEEAFRAAEETYRAYVDALNAVDLSDPTTFEPVYALTTGEALAGDKANFERYSASGLTRSGDTTIIGLVPAEYESGTASIYVCIDVSNVALTDPEGRDAVDPERAPIQQFHVTVVVDDEEAPAIESVLGAGDGPAC